MVFLEHVNITVSNAPATARWMQDVFHWHIRWQGPSNDGRRQTVHVGTSEQYVALYSANAPQPGQDKPFHHTRGFNHLAVVTADLAKTRTKVIAAGFEPGECLDYEPGTRFYFFDHDAIEYEVVCYNDDH